MRNSRKLFFMGTLAVLIVLSTFNTTLVRGQEYSYSSLLVPNVTYEWEVTAMVATGMDVTDVVDYAGESIKQADILAAKILLNVNDTAMGYPYNLTDINNVWIEFYLNGDNVSTDVSAVGLFDLSWMGLGSYYFLEPISYTNETGTFDNFVIYHHDYPQTVADMKIDIDEYDYDYQLYTKVTAASKLSKDTWTIEMTQTTDELTNDLGDPENWYMEHETETLTTELRYNRETGLVTYLHYTYDWHRIYEVEGSLDDDVDTLELIIESTILPTSAPYDWSFAAIGLFVFTLVIFRRRRK